MAAQRFQVTESKPVASGKNYCTIFIEDEAALGEIPQAINETMALGSVAYTKEFDIYFLTTQGWELSG